MIFKLVFKDLLRHWQFTLFFVFNLTIGLTGFVTLETFKEALHSHLKSNAKNILSADLAIEARRELTDVELTAINKIPYTQKSILYDFFAMATPKVGPTGSHADSKLVKIKAVEGGFPFYGALHLRSGRKIKLQDLGGAPKAWVYPEILEQFNLKIGDALTLGHQNFQIDDVIDHDSTQTFRAASLAPSIYIPIQQLKETGLIQFGSTFTKEFLFKLEPQTNPEQLEEQIYKDIIDPAVKVETPVTASDDSGRQLNYLSDYLGLVSLISLFLSALGASYLFRLFIRTKLKDIAIFRALGLSSEYALRVYFIQTFLLGTLALLFSLSLAALVFPGLGHFLKSVLPFLLELNLTWPVVISSFVVSIIGSFCVSLPFLLSVRSVSVSELFAENEFQSDIQAPPGYSFLPAIALFLVLSIYQSHSLKMGVGFSLGFIVTLFFLSAVGWLALACLPKPHNIWFLKYSIVSLQRKKISALALFVSLSLGALLINILPQLKVTLQTSMSVEKNSKLPSLFIFDIQEEQLGEVKNLLSSNQSLETLFSPLVRARLLSQNGQAFERKQDSQSFKTREEERDARFRNRGLNLTYQSTLSDSQEIVEGKAFDDKLDPTVAQLSVEQKYADRLGLKMGDQITFDVQGVIVQGKIVNFRSVRWLSFQPNFFIIVQPGFLEDAPKTFIGTISRMPSEMKSAIQNDLSKRFSNISIIDVDRTVTDVLKIAEQMSLSLEIMAWLSVMAGYVVLYSIIRTQMQSRRWELNLLKILGAQPKTVILYILIEVSLITGLAVLVGASLSLIATAWLSRWIFESRMSFDLFWLVSSAITLVLISLLVTWWAAQKILMEKPHHILTNID